MDSAISHVVRDFLDESPAVGFAVEEGGEHADFDESAFELSIHYITFLCVTHNIIPRIVSYVKRYLEIGKKNPANDVFVVHGWCAVV